MDLHASGVPGGFDWQPFEPLREGGGLTGTPTNFAGAINALRLPDYLRVDLGVRRRWPVPGLGALNTAVRIDNILGRRNALGAVQDARSLRLLPAAGRSVTFEVGWAF